MFGNIFGEALGIEEGINPGDAIMWGYIGISFGDIFSGIFSHLLKSRKKSILWMMIFTSISVIWIVTGNVHSAEMYYFMCCWFGFGTGYWAMFVTIGAEQFGTNIRSTAATTIPNFVRGALILMTVSFEQLMHAGNNALVSAAIVGFFAFFIGIYCTWSIPETHGKDLNFIEE